MRLRRCTRLILLPFFIVWTTGSLAAVSLGLDTTATVQAAAAPGYGPKLQAGGSIGLGLVIPLSRWIAIATSLEGSGVLPSDTSGGFVYRGFGGLALALGVETYFPVAVSPKLGTLSMGAIAAGAAALPAYQYTTLYFFYPELRVGMLMVWRPAGAGRLDFRLQVPVRLQFRRDMSYSFSTGLGFGLSYYLGGQR